MKRIAILLPVAALLLSSAAQAAGDLSRADPSEIVIEMGTSGDKMYFKPDNIELENRQGLQDRAEKRRRREARVRRP